MNKRKFAFIALFTFALFSFIGCSDDDGYADVDGQIPTITLASSHILSDLGYEFIIKGKVEDADGLKSIRLQNAQLNLDKTIDLLTLYKELLFSYDLEYGFKTPRNQEGDRFEILVTVTDVGGRTTESTVLVTMDGDFEAPVFKVAPAAITYVLLADPNLNLRFTVEDNKALDYITVSMPGMDYEETIPVTGKTYSFDKLIAFPKEEKTYELTLTAVDKFALTTTIKCEIEVTATADFPKMYLADVATAEELNSDVFGVPMLIEHTEPFTYKANYYAAKANTEIRFIPQKTDFAPICYGIDPDDETKLINSATAKPIVLKEANVYYEITFNVLTREYNTRTYPIAEAINPIPHVIGSISLDTWGDGGSWLQEFYIGYMTGGPKEVQRFTQDAVNPNLFSLEGLDLTAGETMNFIIHNWHSEGWWNYCTFRPDDSENPEAFGYMGSAKNPAWTKPNTSDKWAKPTVNQTGTYTLWFDAHLERAKLVRQ